MVVTLLSMLGLAILFVLFGWVSAGSPSEGCAGCHHDGSPECGAECPLLKESLERASARLG